MSDVYFWFSATLLGPLRILLFFLFFYILYRLTAAKLSYQTGIEFFVPRFVMGLSAAIIVSLFLTQINGFDTMLILMITSLFFVLSFLNLKRKKPLKAQLQKIYSRLILYVVIRFEANRSLVERKNFRKRKPQTLEAKKTKFWQIGIALFIFAAMFMSRYYFLQYDNYLLSSSWYEDLDKVKAIAEQTWFSVVSDSMGGYAIISLYAKISGLSDMLALSNAGFIESALLAVIIYWALYKITHKHGPGLLAALVFGFGYTIIPLNIDSVLQHKSVFLAMTLALPLMIFNMYPTSFRQKKSNYFLWNVIGVLALSFINLFIALAVLLPFILICLVINPAEKRAYNLRALTAYLVSAALVILCYFIVSYFLQVSFVNLLVSKLVSFDYYTYTPNLILPFSELVWYYISINLALGIAASFMIARKSSRWRSILAILVFVLFLFTIYVLDIPILDDDLLLQLIGVFLPILIGLLFYFIYLPFYSLIKKLNASNFAEISVVLILTGGLFYVGESKASVTSEVFDTKKDILQAYYEIENSRLPYSYAVVNTSINGRVSRGLHYFLSYGDFNASYLQKDKSFARYKADKEYLKTHPEIILPSSVFVFVPEKLNPKISEEVQRNLQILKRRGRELKLVYEGPSVQVFEIVNIPNSSKINELLL
ncbi:hypothetical protein [uncultured Christiangramia sp.]|uniref:hypothetical protein n=1 Tax=uncultured Christiangramia sp. TaxID=503836 RepID=UPI0025DD466D|nr:hypothetical protein [uncultured Christiangramia sp.]|tara:strand:+ start:12456 stop:14417 length:1962 start_codon:yes stop_codon:yes gene_type:complete